MTNLEKFRAHLIRARRSRATIENYLGWARAYAQWARKESPPNSPQEAVCGFLSHLAHTRKSETTQRQALNALAGKNGLYTALGKPLGKLPAWVRARPATFVPVWVTASEAERIATQLGEQWALMTSLMFGAGLRVGEVVSLRWRDLDFERLTITVKQGKGRKDRITFLPRSLVDTLRQREKRCRAIWEEDRARSRPGVQIPDAVANKAPRAGQDRAFFWVFPAAGESADPESGIIRRHHVHKKSLSKALRPAVQRAKVAKRVTAHSFRHGFATAYLLAGGVLPELRDLMGHQSIKTTEIYTHCLPDFTKRVGSPLDHRPTVVPFIPAQAVAPVGHQAAR